MMGVVEQLMTAGRTLAGVLGRTAETAGNAIRHIEDGIALEQAGRLPEAMRHYETAIRLQPKLARAHLCRGNVLLELQDLDGAAKAYLHALSHDPDYAAAHYNLGNVHVRQNHPEAARAAYHTAISLKSDFADAEVALGGLLEDMGQAEEAAARYQRALQINPNYVEVHCNLATTLKALGRTEDAVATYRRALELDPGFLRTYFQLGDTLAELGQHDGAIATYRQLLAVKPDVIEAHNNLGNILKACGHHEEAIASYVAALTIKPDSADVLNNLATALEETGHLEDALVHYRRALEISPLVAKIHNNVGNALQGLGRFQEAISHYRRAIEIGPDLAEVRVNIGSALHRLGQYHEALASYRQALEIEPRHAGVHNNIGTTLKDLDQLSDAIASFRMALEIDPNYRIAFHNLLFVLNYDPDKGAQEIYASYREYEDRFGQPFRAGWKDHQNSREVNRRLKVGYVSPDFKGHACAFFVEPLLANHDKTAVDVYAYADLVREDSVTTRLKKYVEHWVPTISMSDETLAQRIRDDDIDILVDLAGHTSGNRLGVFARKPAPVSLSWLGFGYTTGLRAIDYYLTDETCAPAGSESLFSEEPWRLADSSFAVYRAGQDMGEVSALPALECGYVTLGTLTRGVRINHHTVRVWAQILHRLPTARIVIDSATFKDRSAQEATIQKFTALGVDRARLQVGCHSPPWDVLRGIDIGLDCFPHNSGTTLYETLYMGIPFVTLAGRPSVGRIGATILQGLGHAQWIAHNENEYVEQVVALAADLPKLAQLRRTLRQQMQASVLMDEPGFARKVECAYVQMFQRWVSSKS